MKVFNQTDLILAAKIQEVRRDEKGNPTEETDYFFTFHPNFYKVPVDKKVYDRAVVGKRYKIGLIRIEEEQY